MEKSLLLVVKLREVMRFEMLEEIKSGLEDALPLVLVGPYFYSLDPVPCLRVVTLQLQQLMVEVFVVSKVLVAVLP